jgi:hypothetical protein
MEKARAEHLERWWQFWNVRSDLREAFAACSRYIACSRVTKRPVFCLISPEVCPDGALQTWAFDDDYTFAVLSANQHWEWFAANSSKLEARLRYTRRSVWDTFPFPQSPTAAQVDAVAEAGRAVRRVRDEYLPKMKGGLRALYRTLDKPGKSPLRDAHAALDAAVLSAYGFSAKKPILNQLLDLNLEVASRIDRGEAVTAPGIPSTYPASKRDALVTSDCIQPPALA